MTVLNVRRMVTDPAKPRARSSYRDDLVTVLLSGWLVGGLMLDAWAHNNLPQLESFLTPWHAVFYTGFVATAAWMSWMVWRNMRTGRPELSAVPVGYGLGVLGLPLFAVAGVGDYAWHEIFGIEQGLNILFSPTHLMLVSAMVLIVTSPLRSAWADPGRPAVSSLRLLLPATLALSLATTLVLLFLQYANAMAWLPPWIVQALSNPLDGTAEHGASPVELSSAIMVTNVVLLAPALLLARRWRLPVGTMTVEYLAVAGLCGAITAFASPAILIALVAAGVCADALLAWLRPGPERRAAYLTFAVVVPLVTWSLYFAAASVAVGRPPAVVEFWTGAPVVAALLGLLLAALMRPGGPTAGQSDPSTRIPQHDQSS